MKYTVLIVDDEENIRLSLKGGLEDEGYQTLMASSAEEGLKIVEKQDVDLVLLDIWMPGMDGLQALQEIKQSTPDLPVIIMTGHGSIETAVKATRLGAMDFIEKPLDLNRILVTINNAMHLRALVEENVLLKKKSEKDDEIVGTSPAIQRLKEESDRAAASDSWVLILGENGTGKELVARRLHKYSKRAKEPFIEVNCAAIPEELIESELFGHEKGAFTGAHERRKGKFDLADGGTLFLDEVADMSLRTQAKILRIIQEQVFERVGGTRPIQVDVRIVAATNKDLQKEIEEGRFRQDLYYRLNVIPIYVSPLRERIEDIPMLVEDFLHEMSVESAMGKKRVEPEVIEKLQRHRWIGNVRELRNFIERLCIMTPGDIIKLSDLPRDFMEKIQVGDNANDPFGHGTLREARTCFEREYLLRKLDEYDWNISLTSTQIGVERSHLHRKMRALGIRERDESSPQGLKPPPANPLSSQ